MGTLHASHTELELKMKLTDYHARPLIVLLIAAISCLFPPSADADSLVTFSASGQFLNQVNDHPALLTGGFVVDPSSGLIVSVDFYHGATRLNVLDSAGTFSAELPDIFLVDATNSMGDHLRLLLVAPNNEGTLLGYTGGSICSDQLYGLEPACVDQSFVSSVFVEHGNLGYAGVDDLYSGSVTAAGTTRVPETGSFAMVGAFMLIAAMRWCGRRG